MRTWPPALALLALCSCSGPARVAPAAPPDPPVKLVLAYTGKGGLAFTVLELDAERALVQVTGSGGPADGLVIEHQLAEGMNGRRRYTWYTATLAGARFLTLTLDGPNAIYASTPGVGPLAAALTRTGGAAVDVAALLRLHREQTADGRIARLQRFDRSLLERTLTATINHDLRLMKERCGIRTQVEVSWQGVDDATLREMNSQGGCVSVVGGLAAACQHESPRAYIQQLRVRCRYGERMSVRQVGGALELTAHPTSNGSLEVTRAIMQLRTSKGTLEELVEIDETDVCFADKGRVVISAPSYGKHGGVSYGDGKTFITAPFKWEKGWFFDPRQFNKNAELKRGGPDLRYFSFVDVDRGKQSCRLMCGTRITPLKLATGAQKRAILDSAVYGPPRQREPYALARDRAGTYYYVDRSMEKGRERDFRVFRGPRGKAKLLRMKDVVSDSAGEIFSTQDGKLRLVLSKSEAQWIARGSTQQLLLLPFAENYTLIYNELGVYLGERLGVPCDDM